MFQGLIRAERLVTGLLVEHKEPSSEEDQHIPAEPRSEPTWRRGSPMSTFNRSEAETAEALHIDVDEQSMRFLISRTKTQEKGASRERKEVKRSCSTDRLNSEPGLRRKAVQMFARRHLAAEAKDQQQMLKLPENVRQNHRKLEENI